MDPDEVAKISTEANETTLNIADTGFDTKHNDLQRYLVGKVFSLRVVNRETLKIQVPRILQLRRGVEIEIVGDNIFVIAFSSDDDRRHALQDGPWHFFNSLMVFKAPVGLQNPSDIDFDEVSLWILPFICMNPTAIRKIGEQIGKVEEVDVGESGRCIGQFARVRVCRPIAKPLQRCVRIAEETSGDSIIILVLYEKLPDFCYACGRLGHLLRHCDDNSANKDRLEFGLWLKAGRVMEVRRPRGGISQGLRGRGRFIRGGDEGERRSVVEQIQDPIPNQNKLTQANEGDEEIELENPRALAPILPMIVEEDIIPFLEQNDQNFLFVLFGTL